MNRHQWRQKRFLQCRIFFATILFYFLPSIVTICLRPKATIAFVSEAELFVFWKPWTQIRYFGGLTQTTKQTKSNIPRTDRKNDPWFLEGNLRAFWASEDRDSECHTSVQWNWLGKRREKRAMTDQESCRESEPGSSDAEYQPWQSEAAGEKEEIEQEAEEETAHEERQILIKPQPKFVMRS